MTIGRPRARGLRWPLRRRSSSLALRMTPTISARPLTSSTRTSSSSTSTPGARSRSRRGRGAHGPPWLPISCPSAHRTRHRSARGSLLPAVPSGGCAMPSSRPLVIGAVERAIFPKLNAVRATIDSRLPAIRSADDLYARPPLLLSLTAEPFEYHRRSWPGTVRMVGPCAWEPELSPPAWLETLEPPIVLVATSSEYQADAILAQTAFDALAGTEMTVIATLPSNDPAALRVPTNGRAERFVPARPDPRPGQRGNHPWRYGGHAEGPRRGRARRRGAVRARPARGRETGRGRRGRCPPASWSSSAGHVASRRRHRDGTSAGRLGCRRRLSRGGRSGGCRLPHRGAARGKHLVTWLDQADGLPVTRSWLGSTQSVDAAVR